MRTAIAPASGGKLL